MPQDWDQVVMGGIEIQSRVSLPPPHRPQQQGLIIEMHVFTATVPRALAAPSEMLSSS